MTLFVSVPNLAGVVSIATFSDLRAVVADRKRWLLSDAFVARALREVERLEEGERDLWRVPGRGHDDGLPADVWRRIDEWVIANLATAQR